MNASHLRDKIGGAILAFSILFGIGLASSMTAQAQYRNDDYYRQQQREQRRRQREYEKEQRRREREARRNNSGYYGNNGVYNNGGYYGNNGGYQNDGYYRNDRYGRSNDGYGYGGSYELRQTALNAGYNEGMKEGRNDRNRGDRFNYTDEGAYQNATKDYNSRFGDRGLYQQYFRQAFVNGYTDGYRGY